MYVNYVQKNVPQPLAHKQQSNTFLCCMYRVYGLFTCTSSLHNNKYCFQVTLNFVGWS